MRRCRRAIRPVLLALALLLTGQAPEGPEVEPHDAARIEADPGPAPRPPETVAAAGAR